MLVRTPPIAVVFHADAPPVGRVEVTMLPGLPASTATHSLTVGHEMPVSPAVPPSVAAVESTCTGELQNLRPPVGFLEVITFPLASTTTHSLVVGHETPVSGPLAALSILIRLVHAFAFPAGFFVVTS